MKDYIFPGYFPRDIRMSGLLLFDGWLNGMAKEEITHLVALKRHFPPQLGTTP
jgi:hypothetical protein